MVRSACFGVPFGCLSVLFGPCWSPWRGFPVSSNYVASAMHPVPASLLCFALPPLVCAMISIADAMWALGALVPSP